MLGSAKERASLVFIVEVVGFLLTNFRPERKNSATVSQSGIFIVNYPFVEHSSEAKSSGLQF